MLGFLLNRSSEPGSKPLSQGLQGLEKVCVTPSREGGSCDQEVLPEVTMYWALGS